MTKFMNEEERDQAINELMVNVRRNTQPSKCIDIFEEFLKEIDDKEYVDTVIKEMSKFAGEFSRICKDVDGMIHLDVKAKVLTREFINPARFFNGSRYIAKEYLAMSDILMNMYSNPVYEPEKMIMLSNKNFLGEIQHRYTYGQKEILSVTNRFGNLLGLSVDEVKDMYEKARKVTLMYNYLPAVVKAFLQTKRRVLGLDKNSKKFE